jgi:hypothetical protein
MGKYYMDELEIKFNMVKSNGEDFTDDEIDQFNDEFIELVEKHGYLVGGSIGPYNEDDNECNDDSDDIDEEIFEMGEADIDYPSIDPNMKGPWDDELNVPLKD